MEATMHEAKTSLSKLVARARAGEEIILTNGKARTPIARIVSIDATDKTFLKERPIGMYASQMGDSPFEVEPMSEEEISLWEDSPIVSTWTSNAPLSDDSE